MESPVAVVELADATSSAVLVAAPECRSHSAGRTVARVAWCGWGWAGLSVCPWGCSDLLWDAVLGPRDRQKIAGGTV